jgi:hypothetical protein
MTETGLKLMAASRNHRAEKKPKRLVKNACCSWNPKRVVEKGKEQVLANVGYRSLTQSQVEVRSRCESLLAIPRISKGLSSV